MPKNIVMPREFVNDVARLLDVLDQFDCFENPDVKIYYDKIFDCLCEKVESIERRDVFIIGGGKFSGNS